MAKKIKITFEGLPPAVRSAKILIADDERLTSSLTSVALEQVGFTVIQTSNGKELLEKVESENPDLIILDLVMPEMDGYTTNLKLKENEKTRNIPVLIVSSKGKMRELFELKPETCPAGFLEKPVPVKQLVEKVNEILGEIVEKP